MSDKVLFFTLEYPPFHGGVGNYYHNLVKHYPEEGKVSVLHNNENILINKKLPFFKWLPAFWALNKSIKKNKIDQVVVGNILPLGTVAWLLLKFKKTKYSVVIHGTDIMYTQKSQRKKMLAKIILKNSENIICNSSYNLELLNKLYKNKFKDKIHIVNPGVDGEVKINNKKLEVIKKQYNLEYKIILFTVCRLIKRKGVDKVIESMTEILKEVPNLVYFVMGEGQDKKALEKLRNGLDDKVKDKIVFLGALGDKDKWLWFSLSDIFILPTREERGNLEGFGIVYLEANLLGTPVIGGNSGGVKDSIEDEKSGFLIDPNSKKEIVDKVVLLAKDEKKRFQMGEYGKKTSVRRIFMAQTS
jgi:phosphatidylinositol alpha-1,6-mannosyltransferase